MKLTQGDIDEMRELLAGATARPWRAFDCGGSRKATLALMKGNRPPSKENGYPSRRWPEIIAWPGFDGSDVPLRHRRANLHLIALAINALPALLDAAEAQIRQKGTA